LKDYNNRVLPKEYLYNSLKGKPDLEARKKEMTRKFRGLDPNDLDQQNPEFSCVVCGKSGCSLQGVAGRSCPYIEVLNEREWVKRYNFKKDVKAKD